jgi:glutamine amidotransferase
VRVALIDYQAGNLTSVKKAFAAVGADLFIPDDPADLGRAAAVVVPGVGHFAATAALAKAWVHTIRAGVDQGRPLLGICLGMQWLFEQSDEAPDHPGLGVLTGRCYRLPGQDGGESIKIPHVGWNALELRRSDSIVDGVTPGAQVYFTHSFVAPMSEDTVAVTTHGTAFASIVQRGHVAGVQFHPEKSGDVGLRILRNFLRLVEQRQV